MKTYNIILIDLDGTLTDPKVGITKSVAYALTKFGITVDNLDSLIHFIGPPLPDSFKKYYKFSNTQAKQAVVYFREYFSVKGLFENRLYPGIPELLNDLQSNGKKLILATSKATVFAQQILDHYDINKYFYFVAGSNYDLTRIEKSSIIRYAISRLDGCQNSEIVMVGDHPDDIYGAHENHIDSVGVTYGYGKRADLESAKPMYLVHSIEELKSLILHSKT
jgi:phosphoglycolate phosphatase